MNQVKTPHWRLTYEGVDISRDLSDDFIEVSYTDFLHGKSDTMSLTLKDTGGHWRESWYPAKGDTIKLELGYKGSRRVPAGTFRLDEVELVGSPDRIHISGLAAAITKDLRTRRTRAFEKQTLKQVANQIASEQGLVLFGDVPGTSYERITQADESDVAFLKRLATQAGLAFTVRDRSLVFHSMDSLEEGPAVTTISRSQFTRYSLKDRTRRIYKAAEIAYLDPATKELLSYTETAGGIETGDTLKLNERAESEAQAREKARAALKEKNQFLTQGTVTVEGDPKLLAGNKVEFTDIGYVSGTYLIQKSTHRITRKNVYTTDLEVRRV